MRAGDATASVRWGLALVLGGLLAVALSCTSLRAADQRVLDYVERASAPDPAASLPLLVALHGLGDTPERFVQLFAGFDQPVRLIAPRAPDPYPVGSSWFPLEDRNRAPRSRAAQLARFIAGVRAARPTRGLPVVTGFSQGGALSFALAAHYPEQLAAAVPIAGFLPAGGSRLKKPPAGFRVTALHGTEDQRISYASGLQAVERLRAAGTPATMVSFPGVGHALTPAMIERWFSVLRAELRRASEL